MKDELVKLFQKKAKVKSKPDSFFDPFELRVGTLIETEHTTDMDVAKEIAKIHLMEDRDYYKNEIFKKEREDALKKIEKEINVFIGIGSDTNSLLVNLFKKSKSYPNGTERTWKGKKYKKVNGKWELITVKSNIGGDFNSLTQLQKNRISSTLTGLGKDSYCKIITKDKNFVIVGFKAGSFGEYLPFRKISTDGFTEILSYNTVNGLELSGLAQPVRIDTEEDKFINTFYENVKNMSYAEGLKKINIRFKEEYGIRLAGFKNKINQIKYIDKVLSVLPKGITLKNGMFKKILYRKRKKDEERTLAQYNPSVKGITLLDATDDIGSNIEFNINRLDTLFAGSLYHEIGHSVYTKLQFSKNKKNTDLIKDFKSLYDDYLPQDLITKYAGKNSEEGFCEYFASYLQNSQNVKDKSKILVRDFQKNQTYVDKQFFSFIETKILKHRFFKSVQDKVFNFLNSKVFFLKSNERADHKYIRKEGERYIYDEVKEGSSSGSSDVEGLTKKSDGYYYHDKVKITNDKEKAKQYAEKKNLNSSKSSDKENIDSAIKVGKQVRIKANAKNKGITEHKPRGMIATIKEIGSDFVKLVDDAGNMFKIPKQELEFAKSRKPHPIGHISLLRTGMKMKKIAKDKWIPIRDERINFSIGRIEKEDIERLQNDTILRNQFVAENQAYINSILSKHKMLFMDFDTKRVDYPVMQQEGNIGFIQAIKRFDLKKYTSNAFSTYVWNYIKGYMARAANTENTFQKRNLKDLDDEVDDSIGPSQKIKKIDLVEKEYAADQTTEQYEEEVKRNQSNVENFVNKVKAELKSDKEKQIMDLLMKMKTRTDIARALGIDLRLVLYYLKHIREVGMKYRSMIMNKSLDFTNLFFKRISEMIKLQPSEFLKELLEKGKRGTEGEVRTWNGIKYRKEGKKWVKVKKGSSKKKSSIKQKNSKKSDPYNLSDRLAKTSFGVPPSKIISMLTKWYRDEGEDPEDRHGVIGYSPKHLKEDLYDLLDAASDRKEYNMLATYMGEDIEEDDEDT